MSRTYCRPRRRFWLALWITLATAGSGGLLAAGLAQGGDRSADHPLTQLDEADELFADEHWAEARAAYDRARDLAADWHSADTRRAVEGAVACSLKLQLWDDGLTLAEQYIAETEGSFEEAVGRRFLAGLHMTIPHWGTKRGTTFLRGQRTQGVYVSSWRKDRREAVRQYEQARQILAGLFDSLEIEADADARQRRETIIAERIGVNFDLASALAQRMPQQYGQWGCVGWWWDAEPDEDSDAVDEADYEEPRWWYGDAYNREPPTGIPLGPDGQPQFIKVPLEYSEHLGDGARIRFLLEEIRRLDTSETKDEAARALFRWAMVARSLYGPDTAALWRGYQTRYDQFGRPLPVDRDAGKPHKQIWELTDDEALTLAGGRLRVVTLPAAENPIALLRLLEEEYPGSTLRPEAQYARALYFQTRQQFPLAIAEYQSLIKRYPDHARCSAASQQIALIERPEAMLDTGAVHLPGGARLALSYRNCDKIDLTATRVDLAKYVQDTMEDTTKRWWEYRNIQWQFFNDDRWQKYVGDEAARWSEEVTLPYGNRVARAATDLPLTEPGAYIIEARAAGSDKVTRTLALVTDVAIVHKNMAGKGLIWVVDARTGQPLADKSVKVYEHWADWKNNKNRLHWESETAITNADGVVEYTRKHNEGNTQVDALVLGEGGQLAMSFFQNWSDHDPSAYVESGYRFYVVTDRPVYRPRHTVRFSVWVRLLNQGEYQKPQPNQTLSFEIVDPRNNVVKNGSATTDKFGCFSGDFTLDEEPPLGVWQIRINGQYPDARHNAGGLFRVEEYKKPEFEVTVKPAKTQARLGEKINAHIEARYYFGAPVVNAKVEYKVFRENYRHVYFGPGEYDWLYGKGYGRCYYPYPWFPWWGRWGGLICCESWWPGQWDFGPRYFSWGWYGDPGMQYMNRFQSGTRKALRELVARGTAKLKPDGTYDVEIDTGPALRDLPDRDHRYTVEVEVRDASRRTIEGRGSVTVTRQEFYAFVETDGGWYQPRSDGQVNVRTLTADNVPVAADGEVIIYRVRYGGAGNAEVQEEVLRRWDAATDADGRLAFRLPIPGEGQYRVTFKTRDSWGEDVLGNGVFWVAGPKFDGRVYRFNDLEIIADKRTYAVGDTGHLLINVAENNSRLLFSDAVSLGMLRNYRFIDIPSRTTTVDIPIEERHLPNFFVEGTLVRNGRVHTESRELFVPPVEKLLNVSITTNQPSYKPGETGVIRVEARDLSGEPVTGLVTLTAYDEAVTYIQDEFGPNPRTFYHGQKRYHRAQVDMSADQTFQPWGRFQRAEQAWHKWGAPDGWSGWWALPEKSGRLRALDTERNNKAPADSATIAATDEVRALASITEAPAVGGRGAGRDMGEAAYGFMAAEPMSRSSLHAGLDVGGPGTEALVEPELRTNFADTAVWLPSVKLGRDGVAEAEVEFPQSLTTWRVRGYALTATTQVGDATANAVTTKDLLVRLQSPRFFIERDEVVLSANAHNYLDSEKEVTAELVIPGELFATLADGDEVPATDEQGNLHLRARATVAAGDEHRFDWPVKVLKAGLAQITVKALTDEESDGMRMAFPVLVHGINKTVAQSGSYRVDQDGERTLKIDLPREIDPEQTRLEVTLSPSLAGVMIDALPYLVGYPYGCVEQTMSRFYPTVLVRHTLQKLGTDLETIGAQRRQMRADDLEHRFQRRPESPVFDTDELDRMVRAGLQRIYALQQNDGGWGWWRDDSSSPYQTAYVLQGLRAARDADIVIDGGVYDRGVNFLQNSVETELAKPEDQQRLGHIQTQAYIAYALSLDQRLAEDDLKKWVDRLYEQRDHLNNYGHVLLALAMHNQQRDKEARTLLRNVLQFVQRDDSNETAWVRTPQAHWWFWWNNDIETNSWTLRALVNIDPQNELAPRLVKWLLNNRRNGYYWRGTRDTALTIAAMADYMLASGEAAPDYELTINIDGKPLRSVNVNKDNFFTFDNRVMLYGLQVEPGEHVVTLTKSGSGALYYSCYLSYFTKEEDIKGAGNEIFIEREYFKLVPRTETVRLPDAGAAATPPANQPVALSQTGRTELRDVYTRVPLVNGDAVDSGDRIEVVLRITSKNVYDYLAFEDMKPAGCEPLELRSGGRWAGGLCANLELRDEKVVFFIGLLEQGEHVLRYKLRAETPGSFHALPTTGFAMYAPEVRAISDEMRLRVRD